MKEYLLLFRGGEMQKLSPEEVQKHLQKWGTWIQNLAKDGVFKAGNPLAKLAKTIQGNKKVVTDGPYAESKELVGGYLIIQADDINSAGNIAKDCPIFDVNGITEVREIQEMTL